MFFRKLILCFLTMYCIIASTLCIYGKEVVVGGESIRIMLKYRGVIVTGFYDVEDYQPKDYFALNDCIVRINEQPISCLDDIYACFERYDLNNLNFVLLRNGKTINQKVSLKKSNNRVDTGLYVTDFIQGTGTVTYYDLENKKFACLGHKMSNGNFEIREGTIYESFVTGIVKCEIGHIGQKKTRCLFHDIGTAVKENDYGIFGYVDKIPDNIILETASYDEVSLGPAVCLTVLEGGKVEECKIEILSFDRKNPGQKSIVFEITDNEFLKQTNGVIQGMSGSPIIQNNKLIGCVSHAMISMPERGYGMFIDAMMENS